MKFAMLTCGDPDEWEQAPPAVAAAGMKEIYAWFERWQAAGKLADGGEQFEHPRAARSARGGPDGTPTVTDGPYLELKEVVGGIIFLEAMDLDDAMSIAVTWPGLAYGAGNSVEVRPVVTR